MDPNDSQPSNGTRPPPVSLPLAEVKRLWTRLTAVYGQRFIAQYDGVELPIVTEDWRRRLAGLSLEQLDYALENLEADRPPPDVLTFRRYCVAMPDERRSANRVLGPPRGPVKVPEHVREAFAKLGEAPEEPAHVQLARQYLARWQAEASKPAGERMKPSPDQQAWLEHYAQVLRLYESRKARAAEDAADMARAEAIAAAEPPPPAPIEDRLAPLK